MVTQRELALRFDLPFCIYLRNGPYDVRLGKRTVRIITRKTWRAPHIGSAEDSIAEQRMYFQDGSYTSGLMGQDPDAAKAGTGQNVELVDDPLGRFRFTRVEVWLKHPNPVKARTDQLLGEALTAVNRLVDVFRYAADAAYLPPVVVNDIDFVEVVVPDTGLVSYTSIAGKGWRLGVVNESRAVHEKVHEMLESGEEIPLHEELRLAARRLLGENLWRQAVVESVSSLDAYLGMIFRRHVSQAQMSEDEFDRIMSEPPSDRMKNPLRDATGCSPVDRPSLWNNWVQANKVRRKVVHQGARAAEKDAGKVVEAVEALVAYVENERSTSN